MSNSPGRTVVFVLAPGVHLLDLAGPGWDLPTWWWFRLAARFPAVRVVHDVLFVGQDRVFTSAGLASGIDLALHLVAVDHGPALAARDVGFADARRLRRLRARGGRP